MEGAYNVALVKVIMPEQFERRFVFHLLHSSFFQRPILDIERSAQDGFNKEDLAEIVLPIAPLGEQRRIVAKLETLLGNVEACRRRLVRIPRLLKRFRQSVLAAACSGRLTADWREQNPRSESASDLLTKIARALKDSKRRIEPPVDGEISLSSLTPSALPESWAVSRVGLCFGDMKNGTTAPQNDKEKGHPVTRIETIQNFQFDMNRIRYVEGLDANTTASFRYQPGDIAFSHINSFEHVGKTALYSGEPPVLIHGVNLLRLRLGHEFLNPRFVQFFMRTDFFRNEVRTRVGHAVNQVSINQKSLSQVPLVVAPLYEQHEIVRRVEQLLTLADQLEARYSKAQAHVDRLTQSLLAKAFRGELVPQDPNDEPASALLERIRLEVNSAEKPARRKTKMVV